MRKIVIAGISFLLLQGCATVHKPEVEVIDQKPQVSKVLVAPVAERFLKRKVAIARFSNETKYGQSFLIDTLDENKDRIGKQASDILSAKLAATEKFLLLERSDLDKINKELNLGNFKPLNIPADYLIVGSVSEFGRKEVSDVGIFSRVKKQTAYAKVNVRLLDVHTGQIIYSAEGAGEAESEAGSVMGVGTRAGYDSTLNDKAISAAIGKLVNAVVETLMDKPWRSYFLAEQGGSYVISGGKSQGVKPGDVFGIYQRGTRVVNPQTSMPIELPGRLIGKLRVDALAGSDAQNEVAMCSVADGVIKSADFSELYIQELK